MTTTTINLTNGNTFDLTKTAIDRSIEVCSERKWWGRRVYSTTYGSRVYGLPGFLGGIGYRRDIDPGKIRYEACFNDPSSDEKHDLGIFKSRKKAVEALARFHFTRVLSAPMSPHTSFFATINEDGKVEVSYGRGASEQKVVLTHWIWEPFFEAVAARMGVDMDDIHLMCSSSLDAPESFTKNPDTIALCRALRG